MKGFSNIESVKKICKFCFDNSIVELCHLVVILTGQIIPMCVLQRLEEKKGPPLLTFPVLSASDWKCIVISPGHCNRLGAISSVIRSVFGPLPHTGIVA